MLRKYVMWVSVMLSVVLFAASCNNNNDFEIPDIPDIPEDTVSRVIITVLTDSVNFVTLDTVTVPVVQASVRFYLDAIGVGSIDTTIFTDSNGKAEFIWFEDAIVQYDIVVGSFTYLENFVILKQGETIEETVNIDE